MKKCEWEPCSKPFYNHKLWARFCSELCRRHAFRKARREAVKAELRGTLIACANEGCGAPFTRLRLGQIYCSDRCRKTTGNRNRLQRKVRSDVDVPKAKPKRRSLLCHWCRGAHVSTECPNRAGSAIKLFGTQAPDGSYVPPKGVRVRVIKLPWAMCGDQVAEFLAHRQNRRQRGKAARRATIMRPEAQRA